MALAIGVALLVYAFSAAAASASTADIIAPSDPHDPQVDSGWQAGTCKKEPPEVPQVCSVATPELFFERAAAHPNWGFTQFIVRNKAPGQTPVGELKTVRVDLPVGLSVNPGATGRCPLEVFEAGAGGCEAYGAKVGESAVTASVLGTPIGPSPPLTQVPVYNIVPPEGEPARFGLELAGNEVFLKADVAYDSDYHEGFTIAVPKAIPVELAPLVEGAILKNRLFFNGRAGDGTFITTPSTCLGEAFTQSGSAYSTYLLAGSYQEEAQPGYVFPQSAAPPLESPIPPKTSPKECDTIPYEPGLAVNPNTAATNSPSGAAVTVTVPHITGADNQDSSNTRVAKVSLPAGMGLNPAAANGLETCSDAQFGKGTKASPACPPESKIGTVEIASPPLPEGNLDGNVYVGEQLSRDPASGNEYRIFVDAESARYGIKVKLIGNVAANPLTGQLTTTFAETPQVPFTSFALEFDGGARAVLSSPPICGPNTATTQMTPWSGNPPATPSQPIVLTSQPGGGACAKSMAERPFSPATSLKPDSSKAGAYSPVRLRLSRGDGQQELKGADLLLPPGMVGKLAGIPYCSEAAIATAAGNSGRAEAASSSCPTASQVGAATVSAGTGPSPLRIGGKVFLAGPYHGAPLSLVIVTPATAGPFDLGTAVVRVALFLEPETAQVHAVSDPIPDVFGGAQLSLREVEVNLDRPSFTLNPTSCEPLATTGALKGGGADPTNPAAFSSLGVSVPFQTSECQALGFRPKLKTRLFGGRKSTRRSQHPKFRAVLTARAGDANIRRAALTLPHSEFLEQSHIRTICTRVQLAAESCPKGSVYGYARARTPLLDNELAGPVYLVSSSHELPDLLVDLRGQVDVRVRGVISAVAGRIKTVFSAVPDVPVSKFTITMKGGKKGLLVNSRNLCAAPAFSNLNFKAQNGKQLRNKRLRLRVPACHGKHRRRH
ncbi:MAG TPA: hypothetical protein VHA54_09125 [Solirubrobacterales bacterium]|nr:hypothetical protein [Solirubrobacterales bacterium]